MSGGTFDYRDKWLRYELVPALRGEDEVHGEMLTELPRSRALVADLTEVLAQAIDDLDYHFAGDSFEQDDDLAQRTRAAFARALGLDPNPSSKT